jgi:hypothetical protein
MFSTVVPVFVGVLAVSQPASALIVGTATPLDGFCYPFNCNDSGISNGQSIDYVQLYSSLAYVRHNH